MSFEGKTAVVSGGTGALGQAVCRSFLERGATVFSSYIQEKELADLAGDMKDNPRCRIHRVDLCDETQVIAWFEEIGTVDVLVNVAGGFAMSEIAETTLENWNAMMTMNLTSCFLTCREGLRRMEHATSGRIVNVGAFAATKQQGGMGPYTTSKRGVIHLTEVLAEETLDRNITVNAVLPTIMDTPANRAAMPDADCGTWVPVENVAATIVYLSEPQSWHISGACIPLRGKC